MSDFVSLLKASHTLSNIDVEGGFVDRYQLFLRVTINSGNGVIGTTGLVLRIIIQVNQAQGSTRVMTCLSPFVYAHLLLHAERIHSAQPSSLPWTLGHSEGVARTWCAD